MGWNVDQHTSPKTLMQQFKSVLRTMIRFPGQHQDQVGRLGASTTRMRPAFIANTTGKVSVTSTVETATNRFRTQGEATDGAWSMVVQSFEILPFSCRSFPLDGLS